MALDPRRQTMDHNERRIGERHPIAIAMQWYPTRKPPRRRKAPESSMTENLSFSGAGFICDTHPDVQVSTMLTVTLRGVTGQARVRVVEAAGEHGQSYYGIEFCDRPLLDVARDLITDHAPASPRTAPVNRRATSPNRSSYRDWPD